MRSQVGQIACAAVLWCLMPHRAMCLPDIDDAAAAGYDSCLKEAVINAAGRELTITLHDAELIRLALEEHLANSKPNEKSPAPRAGEVWIDCQGTVRMGVWILESSWSDEPDLDLTTVIHNGENLRVWRVIRVRYVGGQWKVVGESHRTAHGLHR